MVTWNYYYTPKSIFYMYEDIRSSENQLQLNAISHESLMFAHLQVNLIMDRGSVRTDM